MDPNTGLWTQNWPGLHKLQGAHPKGRQIAMWCKNEFGRLFTIENAFHSLKLISLLSGLHKILLYLSEHEICQKNELK